MIHIKEDSFINKANCTRIANLFREWAKLGGHDYYEASLSPEKCENIADQFEIARERGGRSFCHIINRHHFTDAEIETILRII